MSKHEHNCKEYNYIITFKLENSALSHKDVERLINFHITFGDLHNLHDYKVIPIGDNFKIVVDGPSYRE